MIKKLTLSLSASLAITVAAHAATVYATVDNEEITDQDIAMIIRNPQVKFETLPESSKIQIVNQLIEKKLLTKKALSGNIQSTAAYKEAVEKLKKDLVLEIWMQEEFKKIKVTDKEIKDYYNSNPDQFKKGAQLKARHILLQTEDEAKEIIKELDSKKDKLNAFIEFAKTKSMGPSGTNGGDLGWFEPKQMVPEFSQATMELAKNSYTKTPVKTQYGFHVIYLEDKKDSSKIPLEEVSNNIKQMVTTNKFRETIKTISDEMRKSAKITINKNK